MKGHFYCMEKQYRLNASKKFKLSLWVKNKKDQEKIEKEKKKQFLKNLSRCFFFCRLHLPSENRNPTCTSCKEMHSQERNENTAKVSKIEIHYFSCSVKPMRTARS